MHYTATPHLTTALTGSLNEIEQHIIGCQTEIESWFQAQWKQVLVPFYASVDLRNSGYKIAPVDTNLFPAGFNNLNPAFTPLCTQAVNIAVGRFSHSVKRILLISENHTRNKFYFENLSALKKIISEAGFEVRIGSMMPNMEAINVTLESGEELHLEPLKRKGAKIAVGEFIPDLIVLNNDLSLGRPDIFDNLQQTITPALDLGWSKRMKSIHFKYYQQVTSEFAKHIGIDPWFIAPLSKNCGAIDFMKREGGYCLEKNVGIVLEAIQNKYNEYGITDRPYVVVKADRGTYGMGIMIVHSVADITQLNRKQRTRMATIKEGQKVSEVIIQEGVYTHETWERDGTLTVAEPVIYMIDTNIVGGFYRVHDSRDVNENLNAVGMRFEPLDFEDCCISADTSVDAHHNNRFYSYSTIARLALLAAAKESLAN